jgi:archaeal type IV pilus assembly protein PilA
MAIGVAYWAMGIGNSFTKFEKVEWISIYADPASGGVFNVHIQLKNTGSAAATIDNIYIDQRPYTTYANVNQTNLMNQTLNIGSPRNGNVYLPVGGAWTSGNTVSITISTAAGREYPNFVVIP